MKLSGEMTVVEIAAPGGPEQLKTAIRPVPTPGEDEVLIRVDAAGVNRAEAMAALKARGVGSQVHYIPVHRQPYYAARYGVADLPGADAWYARCLSLS